MAVYNPGPRCVARRVLFAITVISFPTVFSRCVSSPSSLLAQLTVHSTFLVTNGVSIWAKSTVLPHISISYLKTGMCWSNSRTPETALTLSKEREREERETLGLPARTSPPLAAPSGKIPDHNNLVYVYPACTIEGRQTKRAD